MDHVVYLDSKAKELEMVSDGSKTMIVRGAMGRKLPYGKVEPGDRLFFLRNNGEGLVRASATVKSVLNSDRLSAEQSAALLEDKQPKLNLTPQQTSRWSDKKYLVLIELEDFRLEEPFGIDRSAYGNMDDWLPVGEIGGVRL